MRNYSTDTFLLPTSFLPPCSKTCFIYIRWRLNFRFLEFYFHHTHRASLPAIFFVDKYVWIRCHGVVTGGVEEETWVSWGHHAPSYHQK
uniref:Uncharacterized protein n=1 Tax=Geospiza parvula TaxID=87175 RepID=A0A8U8BEP1_GEOPR